MAAGEDADLIRAAVTIRQELAGLVPADAEVVGAKLDAHLIRVEIVPTAERPAVVNGIVELLEERSATRERLGELFPDAAAERGIPGSFWAWDHPEDGVTLCSAPPFRP